MKKFIIGVIAIAGLVMTVVHMGCSTHKHTKQMHNYGNDSYHKNYDDNRGMRYEHPRYF